MEGRCGPADGKVSVIDQNRAVVSIEAPQDKEIAKLGVELNKTYLALRGGRQTPGAGRQMAQDANVATLPSRHPRVAQRAVTKASVNYKIPPGIWWMR